MDLVEFWPRISEGSVMVLEIVQNKTAKRGLVREATKWPKITKGRS